MTTTDTPGPIAAVEPSSPAHKQAFALLNASTAPVWLAMILFPRARVTGWLVRRCSWLFAGLGVAYTALLAAGVATGGEKVDFRDPDSLRAGLANPTAFLAGWTHYLAFDLFVGRWIWETNVAAGRSARLPLLLTWWFGPVGLTLELARRRRR
ncbi:MAG: ABA4-like family protein [Acidimicrobiales bacterium]